MSFYQFLLNVLEDWCYQSPKNYQVWYHRRWLVEKLLELAILSKEDLLSPELAAIEDLIHLEPKHYNAWSHRLFLANTFNLLSSSSELNFTKECINRDVRNNSAWSYRRHVLEFVPVGFDMNQEFEYCIEMIKLAPSNESAWVYLMSLPNWLENEAVVRECEFLFSSIQTTGTNSYHYKDLMSAILEIRLAASQLVQAYDLLLILEKIDPIRASLYKLKRNRLEVRS